MTLDLSVPRELLRLVDGKIIDDDSLDAWVSLPGNVELLRVGAQGGSLTREALRENLWHSILGHSTRRGEGLGSLAFEPLDDLRSMVRELTEGEDQIRKRVVEHTLEYLPDDLGRLDVVVRLQLGGVGIAHTRDAVYLNLTWLHLFRPPWLGSVEVILSHELVHMAHRSLDVVPSDALTPQGLFAAALAQVHAEGIARHAGHDLMQETPMQGEYADLVRSQHDADLASFPDAIRVLMRLRDTCLYRIDMPACRSMIREGLRGEGTIYATGHGMARAIEEALGRRTLAATLASGPIRFFELYEQATRMLPGLPALGPGFDEDLAAADKELAGMRLAWRLRREAMRLHGKGDFSGAVSVLGDLTRAEPYDPIAAYNMACALARKGDERSAVDWLEKAISLGYSDREHLERDPDLESLRDRPDYRRLLSFLDPGSGEPASPNASR